MSYTITRASDDDPTIMLLAIEEIAKQTTTSSSGSYYVDLEGEPGEVLAAGKLLAYSPEMRTASVQPAPDGVVDQAQPVVVVDCERVTQLHLP